MNWLVLAFAISGGLVPSGGDAIVTAPSVGYVLDAPSDALFVDMSVKADVFKHIRLWGNAESYMTPKTVMSFDPYRIDYVIGAAVYVGPLELGIRHECDHGVTKVTEWRPFYIKRETQVYLSVSGEIKF